MELPQMILEDGTSIIPVHFLYQSPQGTTQSDGKPLADVSEYTWKIACSPHLIELSSRGGRACPYLRSDDCRAVSCPLCKKTDIYKEAVARLERASR